MGFRFKLEALKRYRQFQEETCQKAFSEAQRHHEREIGILEKMIAQRNKTESEMKGGGKHEATSHQLILYTRYLERLERQIVAQQQTIEMAQMNR